jgi:hypothetical protein
MTTLTVFEFALDNTEVSYICTGFARIIAYSVRNTCEPPERFAHARLALCVGRVTSAKFGLHAGRMKFNIQNEE